MQPRPGGIAEVFIVGREFVGKDRVGLILGDNLFYGDSLPAVAERGARGKDAVIYAYWVSDPSAYGVVEFDGGETPVGIVEKPKAPRSNWAVTGLYFYDADVCDVAAQIPRSARGELEITDVNAWYLKERRLKVEKLGRGYAWLDTGTPSSLLRAAQFVETVEDRQGLQIGSPEEVAWRKGYIDDAGLARLIEPIARERIRQIPAAPAGAGLKRPACLTAVASCKAVENPLSPPPSGNLPGRSTERGRSSGVEHDLAKVGVEGSNPFARSNLPISCYNGLSRFCGPGRLSGICRSC